MNFFNSFTKSDLERTPIFQNLTEATNAKLSEPDWSKVFIVKEAMYDENSIRTAVRALKRIIFDSSPIVCNHGILVLDTMFKMCDYSFQFEVVEGYNLVKKVLDSKVFIHSKGLDHGNFEKFVQVLYEWKNNPEIDLRIKDRIKINSNSPPQATNDATAPHQRSQSKESLPQRVTQNQVLLDIQVATSYVQMLQEALAYVDPEKDDINSNELVQEFYGKCREIEPRINNAILNISDELLLAQLLKTNSDMTNAFKMRDDIIEATALNYAKKISQTKLSDSNNHADFNEASSSSNRSDLISAVDKGKEVSR